MNAITNQMAVIDVSHTVTALHQSVKTLTDNRYHDDNINSKMAGNLTQMDLGLTKCAHFETEFSPTNHRPFMVAKRGKHSPCWAIFEKHGIDKNIFQTLIPGVS